MTRTVNTPPNVDVDDNLSIVVLDPSELADPSAPTVTVLTAAEEVVWQMPPDGFNDTATQETKTDPRLAKSDIGEAPGKVTYSLEVTYFYGEPELTLDTQLVRGAELVIVVRDSVPVVDDFEAAQLVDVFVVEVGVPIKQRTTGGKQTKKVKLFVREKFTDVALAA